MSVNSYAVLFLGKEEGILDEISVRDLPNFDYKEFRDEGNEYLIEWTIENGYCSPDDDCCLVHRSGDEVGLEIDLIGFELAMVGVGNVHIFEDLAGDIVRKSTEFKAIFGVDPETFVLCYRW